MKRRHVLNLVAVCLLLPHLYYMVVGREEWPFSCFPMYADYVGPETPLYVFAFELDRGLGAEALSWEELGVDQAAGPLSRTWVSRFLMERVYRSCEDDYPVGPSGTDSVVAFEQRLTQFFAALLENHQRRTAQSTEHWRSLSLIVRRLERPGVHREQEHVVGRYDLETGRFMHLWGGES